MNVTWHQNDLKSISIIDKIIKTHICQKVSKTFKKELSTILQLSSPGVPAAWAAQCSTRQNWYKTETFSSSKLFLLFILASKVENWKLPWISGSVSFIFWLRSNAFFKVNMFIYFFRKVWEEPKNLSYLSGIREVATGCLGQLAVGRGCNFDNSDFNAAVTKWRSVLASLNWNRQEYRTMGPIISVEAFLFSNNWSKDQ